ncbi:MAG: hypothetical protein ABJB97_13160 [Acidobacteriota bacterium]
MAKIKSTELAVAQGSQSNKAKVTVKSQVEFTQGDTGDWKVGINLFGDDTADGGGTPLIYTFKFGNSIFVQKDFKIIQATPGEMQITESREINWGVLDEDPGEKKPQNAPPGSPGLPLKDEVFAKVTLTREGKSNLWTSPIGA